MKIVVSGILKLPWFMIFSCNLRRLFFIHSLIVISVTNCNAQLWRMRRTEATFGFGGTYFFSDIGGYNSLEFNNLYQNPAKGNLNLNLKYRITSKITGRLSLTYGQLSADDAMGQNSSRGYSCLVSFYEPAIIGEFYILRNSSERSVFYPVKNMKTFKKVIRVLDIYAFTGIGAINYNINANEALSTVMRKSTGSAVVFPAGAGMSVVVSPDLSLGMELGGRFAFSDELDGFTSPYSQSNDIYYFLNLVITFKKRSASTTIN
jgi:hypothetical protein